MNCLCTLFKALLLLFPTRVPAIGTLTAVTVVLCLTSASWTSDKVSKNSVPDVQVLVLTGRGPADEVSINYTIEASNEQASSDLAALARETNWTMENIRTTTRSASAPGIAPTTSVLFDARGIVNAASGTLALEPFVGALKRFESIEILYINVPEMQFRGLEDFDNEFVKINLSRTGSSYRYRVRVKDSNFDKLDLPVNQPTAEPVETGARPGARVMLIVGVALLGAVLVYLAVAYLSRLRGAQE